MMSKNQKPPTKAEKERIDRMMKLGCIISRRRPWPRIANAKVECHHITRGGKRLGHWYTIPLTSWHHRGAVPYPAKSKEEARAWYGASLADGSKAFIESHGVDEMQLWEEVQKLLDLPAERPVTKIIPRKIA